MPDREKLIALLESGGVRGFPFNTALADHLIANGVVVSEEIKELRADNERLREMWAKSISELSKAKAEKRWIPVEERLPEAQGYYMVYHKNSKIAAERFYYKDCPDLFVAVSGDPVTHWMPPPQPPKEVE